MGTHGGARMAARNRLIPGGAVLAAVTVLVAVTVLAAAAALTGCETVEKLAGGIRKPKATVVSTGMTDLSFEGIALRFDVRLDNPNPIGIELAGFDYELLVDENSFVSGTYDRAVEIEAEGESIIPIPVAFRFEDLLGGIQSLADRNETAYTVTTGFTFDLPVLDRVRVAASHSGTFPVVRLPALRVQALRLERLSLRGAELALNLEVDNPNVFLLFLNTLDYELSVDGERWAAGTVRKPVEVDRESASTLEIPIELDLLNMGRSVYGMLTESSQLDYGLSVDIGVGTSLPLIEPVELSFAKSGRVPVVR